MIVKQLATFEVKSCTADTDLATAAKTMWDGDCGVVPVVNDQDQVIGMVTDRDICIAAATRASRPGDIRVSDVMSRDVAVCRADDDVRAALNTMKEQRVRRLPVLNGEGRLAGILSMNDVVMRAGCRPGAEVSGEAFLETMKAICARSREEVPA